ncbi:MAG: phosphatase, partial [Clostridia bacterium]|nr:phosphatase [Clostridia bacterium]
DKLFPVVKEMKEYGMDGMECYYNNYTSEFAKMCREMCRTLNLLQSGGSDFHGANKPSIELGEVSTGFVPYDVLERMKEYISSK